MRFLFALSLLLVLPASAHAGCNSREMGGTTFTNCDDGTSYTAREMGGTTFYSGDINATSREMGGTTFYSGDVSGTSREVGGTTFHNLNGVSGTSREMGGTTFHSFDNGVSGTSKNMGGTKFSTMDSGFTHAEEKEESAELFSSNDQPEPATRREDRPVDMTDEEVRW